MAEGDKEVLEGMKQFGQLTDQAKYCAVLAII